MKRSSGYIIGAAVLAIVMTTAAGVWLLGTTEGAGWLLKTISRNTSLKISARTIQGRLFDHLRLEGVRIVLPHKEAQFDSLDVRWHPLLLLGGVLSADELILQNVRIQDNAPLLPKREPVLSWPRVPAFAELLEANIGRLEATPLTYRRLSQEPVRITSLSTSIAWRETLLSLSDLTVISPDGRIAGNIVAGLSRPSLQADIAITPMHPLAEMNLFYIHTRLLPGNGTEQLAGSVTISGRSGRQQHLELTGEAGVTRNSVNLRKLRLITPGRRGTVTGEGKILLAGQEPIVDLQMRVASLDLAPELKRATDISGTLTLTGTSQRYRGHLAFTNKGKSWQTFAVAGDYQGNRSGIAIVPLSGSFLDGAVEGNLAVGWTEGFSVRGALRGSNLNPARLSPDWTGLVNFDLSGNAAWSKGGALLGEVSGKLLESRLHGQPLKGEVAATFDRENAVIRRLALHGKGFDLEAAGQLDRRLDVSARIADLSRLVPELAGELDAKGWVRWRDRRAAGALTVAGRDIAADGIEMSGLKLAARLGEGEGYPVHLDATLTDLLYGSFETESAIVVADGTLARHSADATLRSTGAEARIGISGGYAQGMWRGNLVRLSGRDSVGPWNLKAPASLAISAGKVSVASLVVNGSLRESLEVNGELTRDPLRGSLRGKWQELNAARLNAWVSEARFTGSSSGNINLNVGAKGALTLAGTASARGTITANGHSVSVERSSLHIDGGESGIHASVELRQTDGGTLKGDLTTSKPARLALPEEGKVGLTLTDIDLALLRPWFPAGVDLQGTLAGRAAGKFLQGQRLQLDGQAAISGGRIHVERAAGEVNANIRSATALWKWRGETLGGNFAIALAETGTARGSFELPLPARLPVSIEREGEVRATVTAHAQEKGLLTTMFPGLIQESHGEFDADVRVTGKWEDPRIAGTVLLDKAGAYLPAAGIRAENIRLAAQLEGDQIKVDSFEATSGPGRINGTAVIQLKGWQVASYRGSLKGERFRTVYFPELQVLSSPDLKFDGSPEKLVVRGEIRLPELLIFGPPTHNKSIEPSKDVIVEGMPPPAEKSTSLALDIEVRVALGERVLVKAEGIDAELGGAMDLALRSLDKITSKGEIKVVKGNYKTYGVNLKIVRGRVFYAGGPIRQPTLDILALRTIGEVRAGVTIVGTPQAPIIKLYSEPAMPDVDILAYMVLGHPLGSSSNDQAGLMAGAATALLSAGQSVVLQDEIKNRLGLSTLELESTTGGATGLMGYKEVQVTPPGKAPAKQATVSQTMLTVGKYLTPELYISYARSVFTGGNLFRLRYDLFKHWQIQSETGSESGVDLYYKIDFD